jgi:SAM-dependent methyltransferase
MRDRNWGINVLKNMLKSILPTKVRRYLFSKHLKITRKDIDFYYNDDFVKILRHENVCAEKFCGLFIKYFNPKSVIDFGCGIGNILCWFEKRGIDILGIDGSKACYKHTLFSKKKFLLFDLRNSYKIQEKYDLCICLEVAEHIEEKYSDTLVDSLTSASDNIVFSAARPTQGGTHHVNLKPYEWWIKKFTKRGFKLDQELTNDFKKQMHDIPTMPGYYVNNLMIFKNELQFLRST